MGAIPANLTRVPNALASRIALAGIQKTNREFLQLQVRLAAGKEFTRPSENAIGSSTVSVLDDAIERRDQRVRNLSQADATLNSLDNALGDVSDLLQEARDVLGSGLFRSVWTQKEDAQRAHGLRKRRGVITKRGAQDRRECTTKG